MKINATHLRACGKRTSLLVAISLVITGAQVSAQDEEDRPVTDKEVTASDIAETPVRDLGLTSDEIPVQLRYAQANPYSLEGIFTCAQYQDQIRQLDTILGPDFDVTQAGQRQLSLGSLAQSVVTSFIPFRGIIREVSGARQKEQEMEDAIIAGMMRRSYLKGIGSQKGCDWPARPATQEDKARFLAEHPRTED